MYQQIITLYHFHLELSRDICSAEQILVFALRQKNRRGRLKIRKFDFAEMGE